MQNITTEFKGGKLIITIDTTKDFGPSKSGKSVIIASTGGNAAMATPTGTQFKLGINCYK